jgi:hypothetical protein
MTVGAKNTAAVTAFKISYMFTLCALIFTFVFMSNPDKLSPGKLLIFLPLWSVICLILVMLYNYDYKIIGNQVSDYYGTFITLTTGLLFFQVYIILNNLLDGINKSTTGDVANLNLGSKMIAVLKLLAVLNIISAITAGIVLKYYTTDC